MTCDTDNTLEEYASELNASSLPGNNLKSFLSPYNNLSPIEQLATVYNIIENSWKYEVDEVGSDVITNSEVQLTNDKYLVGDCDDKAALLMAVCRYLELNAVFCLGKDIVTHKGHVWLEVEVCHYNDYNGKLKKRLEQSFNDQIIIYNRNNIFWLQLEDSIVNKRFSITHIVDQCGQIVNINNN